MSEVQTPAAACPHCHRSIPPSATRCPSCQQDLPLNLGRTAEDEASPADSSPAVPPPMPEGPPAPQPGELPPRLRLFDLAVLSLLLLALAAGIALKAAGGRVQLATWIAQCATDFGDPQGRGLQAWRIERPPQIQEVNLIEVRRADTSLDGLSDRLIESLGLTPAERYRLEPEHWSEDRLEQMRAASTTGGDWLVTILADEPTGRQLDVLLHTRRLRGLAAFAFHRRAGMVAIYGPLLLPVGLGLALGLAVRWGGVLRWRRHRAAAWDAYQAERARRLFRLQEIIEESQRLAETGQSSRALARAQSVLSQWPAFPPAIALRRRLAQFDAEDRMPLPATILYLRVVGTPYAYQAPAGSETVTVGRQRKRSGGVEGTGNDLVIRVPGADDKTLRISRRHLEIRRIAGECFAVDRSTAGTRLNGRPMLRDEPAPIRSGDHLSIADVLTLEVLIRAETLTGMAPPAVDVSPSLRRSEPLLVEATVGDLKTVDPE